MLLQLSEIKRIIISEIEEKEFTYNYLICEKECSFLDINKLQTYLAEQNINKTIFLKKINILCTEINSLWNNELQKLPHKKIKESFEHNRYRNSLNFIAFYLTTDCKFSEYNSIQGKIEFLNEYDITLFSIAKIAHRCTEILNYITAAYPETSNISGNKIYEQYILTGFFGFPETYINQDNKLEEYEGFYNKVSSKFIDYKFIFDKLPLKKKIEFKNDYSNQLRKFKDKIIKKKTEFKNDYRNLLRSLNGKQIKKKTEFKNDNSDLLRNIKDIQKLNKFIEVLNATISDINDHYLIFDYEKKKTCQKPNRKNIKTLFNFLINISDKDEFINELKKTFNSEKGIKFRILIEILKENKIFLIGDREFKQFYEQIKNSFNRDIGTYSALNDLYRPDKDIKDKEKYKNDIENISIKLNPLIFKYKTN